MARSSIETSRLYAFERGGPKRLELRWGASFKEVRVLFEGADVGTLERKSLPRDGAKLTLPDGSVLSVRLRGFLGIELTRDGVHLPESDLDPRRVLRNAALLMGIAAVADVALDGLVARRALAAAETAGTGDAWSRDLVLPLALDGALLVLAIPTALGSRIALAVGIAAFASRFGLHAERSTWTLIYGVVTTWLLAMHFFALSKRSRR